MAVVGCWIIWGTHLSVQWLLAGELIFQLVFDIMERSRLPLGAEVPAFNTATEILERQFSGQQDMIYAVIMQGHNFHLGVGGNVTSKSIFFCLSHWFIL